MLLDQPPSEANATGTRDEIVKVEQIGVIVELYGGELNRISYSDPIIVKNMLNVLNWVKIFELNCAIWNKTRFFTIAL